MVANALPAATLPIPAWIPAAILPAATPVLVVIEKYWDIGVEGKRGGGEYTI
jgi:hypothetical protein